MTALYKGMGFITGLALMIIMLISSTEFVAYYMNGYFEKEYAKYQVTEAISIEMEDLLTVTDEMMDYLRGDREDLVIYTKIGNIEREFFNAKEKKHMQDVQKLFLDAQQIRFGAVLLVILVSGCLLFFKKGLCLLQGIQWGILGFMALIGMLAGLMAYNFNRYFTLFHLLLFNNDDWILNPQTDLLINIVPEGFFRDTAFWIAGLFIVGALFIWLLAWFLLKGIKTGE